MTGCDKSHISTVKFWKLAYKGIKKREEKKFYCSSSAKEHIKLSQRRTMELFSTLQLKYFRNRRLKCDLRASLVAQWLRICLTMQGTQVRALVREDPTCRGATKPVHHNCWACVLEPASHNYWAHVPQLLKPARLEPVLRNKRSHCNEKPMHCNEE